MLAKRKKCSIPVPPQWSRSFLRAPSQRTPWTTASSRFRCWKRLRISAATPLKQKFFVWKGWQQMQLQRDLQVPHIIVMMWSAPRGATLIKTSFNRAAQSWFGKTPRAGLGRGILHLLQLLISSFFLIFLHYKINIGLHFDLTFFLRLQNLICRVNEKRSSFDLLTRETSISSVVAASSRAGWL